MKIENKDCRIAPVMFNDSIRRVYFEKRTLGEMRLRLIRHILQAVFSELTDKSEMPLVQPLKSLKS